VKTFRARLLAVYLLACLVPAMAFWVVSRAAGWQQSGTGAILLFLLLAAGAAFGIVRYSRRLAEALQKLSRAAKALEEGRTADVLAELPNDSETFEVARLSNSFRAMAEATERRLQTLSGLSDLNRRAGATLDLAETLSRITKEIAAFFRSEGCGILLFNPLERTLEFVSPAVGVTPEEAATIRLPVGPGSIAGRVFETGEPYLSNDVASDPNAATDIVRRAGVRNGVFVPLRNEQESIGVLAVINRPQGFTSADLDAAVAFADASAVLLRRARLYRQLEGTVAELRRANYLKEHFLQNVSHELRTPLTSILGWSELLAEEQQAPRVLGAGVRQIRQASTSLLMLIDDLLDLSRLERGGFKLNREPLRASEIAARALDNAHALAASRGIRIEGPQADGDAVVEADALRVQQVFWNLINNAVRFSRQGGTVRISYEKGLDAVIFHVEDDGIGISAAELPHVFERFRQADGSVTRGSPGLGIGLSIAKTIVEMHGGAIWVRSEPGKGSRFSFSIPRRA
jgi:signal transduction histidine kinase/HAMP domain-containing protein